MKLKYARYQLVDDILLKINFDRHLWKQCVHAYVIRYMYGHKTKSSREKELIPLYSMTIEHPSKIGKLNGVYKIILDLFNLSKNPLITTIHFMIDNFEASRYFQPNVFKIFGVPYRLTLKLISKHSINYFLPNIQKIIIKYDEDWNDGVTYQNALGKFSFSLVYGKQLRFSPNIYLLSLLLPQFSLG